MTFPFSRENEGPSYYPPGCIGANLGQRNYVKYLVNRYLIHDMADCGLGLPGRFYVPTLCRDIVSRFKAPTYFIPDWRFAELVDYLQGRIDGTQLGRLNRTRGISNYESLEEYLMKHIGSPAME